MMISPELFRSLNALIGARVASFFKTNGLNDFSKSVIEQDGSCFDVCGARFLPAFMSLLLATLGFLKKADMRVRDFVCASSSLRSLSSLAAFLSAFSFS